MDLATGARAVWVMMTLFGRGDTAKLVPECSYPLTGRGCVSRVYTDMAVFELDGTSTARVSRLFGTTFEELRERLPVELIRDDRGQT